MILVALADDDCHRGFAVTVFIVHILAAACKYDTENCVCYEGLWGLRGSWGQETRS